MQKDSSPSEVMTSYGSLTKLGCSETILFCVLPELEVEPVINVTDELDDECVEDTLVIDVDKEEDVGNLTEVNVVDVEDERGIDVVEDMLELDIDDVVLLTLKLTTEGGLLEEC